MRKDILAAVQKYFQSSRHASIALCSGVNSSANMTAADQRIKELAKQYNVKIAGTFRHEDNRASLSGTVTTVDGSLLDLASVHCVILTNIDTITVAERWLNDIKNAANYTFTVLGSIYDLAFFNSQPKNTVIRFDGTNGCNLKCGYCYRREPFPKGKSHIPLDIYCAMHGLNCADEDKQYHDDIPPAHTSAEDFRKLVGHIGTPDLLALSCATEPLINDNLHSFLAATKDMTTSLVTNAVLLTEETITQMIDCRLDNLTISLDSYDDSFTRKHTGVPASHILDKLALVRRLKQERQAILPKVSLSCVMFKENLHHLEGLVAAADNTGATSINVAFLLPRSEAYRHEIPNAEEIRAVMTDASALKKRYGIDLTFSYDNTLRRERVNGFCCIPLQQKYINYKGDCISCYKEIIGNVFRQSIEDIDRANRDDLVQALHMNKPFCQHCYL